MRKNRAILSLLATELAVAALSMFYQLKLRASVLAAFVEFGTEPPPLTRLALAPWFQPVALGFAAVLSILALALPLRRSRRQLLIQIGLTGLALAVIFAVTFAVVPIFNPLG